MQIVAARTQQKASQPAAHNAWVIGIAAAIAVLHLATNGRYGFHRDELQFLSDARHLDWGFVSYPPFTPVIERISLILFGTSLVGLRLFSVLAQAVAIVTSALMARELRGGGRAQVYTALAVALSPLPLFWGTEFQYSSFDYLWWVLAAYFIIRLLNSQNPRWWLAIGAVLGVGAQTKYSIAFFVAGILGGMLLSQTRRWFASRWFWAGIAVALLIASPNLIWQARHDWISLHFLQYIHARDVHMGRDDDFVSKQFWINVNLCATPLWVAGLVSCFRTPRLRLLGWMYAITFGLFVLFQARSFYLAPAYPMLIGQGAVVAERWMASRKGPWRLGLEALMITGLLAAGAQAASTIIPLAERGPIFRYALTHNLDLREEIGWEDQVAMVASIRDALPPERRASYGVVTANYGEQGAVELYGPAYHLPPPISMTNSGWLRAYPTPQPTTLIVLGFTRNQAEDAFIGCRLAGVFDTGGIENEESKWHSQIFLCGSPRLSWPEFWKKYQNFG